MAKYRDFLAAGVSILVDRLQVGGRGRGVGAPIGCCGFFARTSGSDGSIAFAKPAEYFFSPVPLGTLPKGVFPFDANASIGRSPFRRVDREKKSGRVPPETLDSTHTYKRITGKVVSPLTRTASAEDFPDRVDPFFAVDSRTEPQLAESFPVATG